MWLTITLILVAMIVLVALEAGFLWRLGERDDGRRSRARRRVRFSEADRSRSGTPRREGPHRRRGAQRDREANLSGPVSR
jgi:hypothetical protein